MKTLKAATFASGVKLDLREMKWERIPLNGWSLDCPFSLWRTVGSGSRQEGVRRSR